MDDEKANDTSEILVEADMMGHSTHGVRLLPLYIKDIEEGNMNVTGNQTVINDTGSCITIDGDKLPGIWLTKRGLKLSSERSKIHGVSTVLIKNSHHNGALAAYLLPIVQQGLVPMIKCSVPSSATVAPFGGTKALLTPDPMALAFPTNDEPVLIDISASITTNNTGNEGPAYNSGAGTPSYTDGTNGQINTAIAMAEGVEAALLQLISKVEASQSLIDELELQVQQLKLQLENQEKMQEELEYYFLMSRKQSVIIKAAEQLQARSAALFTRVVPCVSSGVKT